MLCALTRQELLQKMDWTCWVSDQSSTIKVLITTSKDNLIIDTSKLSFAKLVKDVTKLAPAISPETREKELQNYIAVSQSSTGKATIYQKTRMFPSEHMLEIMAACHGLTYVKNELIGKPFIYFPITQR